MDPDKALEEIRKRMGELKRLCDLPETDLKDLRKIEELSSEVVDYWDGLDRWMNMAGALPRDWARHR